jgi:type IV pilus assembly protein PilX
MNYKRNPLAFKPPALARQKGVALFMVLMVTLVIVALSVSLATNVFSDQKSSRSAADLAIAREAAEAALRDAENDLNCQQWNGSAYAFFATSTGGTSTAPGNRRPFCDTDPSTQVCEQLGDLGATQTCDTTANGAMAGIVAAPLVVGTTRGTPTNFQTCNVTYGAVTNQTAFKTDGTTITQPRYAIEVFSDMPTGSKATKPIYRITARGYGRNPSTTVDLESIFRPCN